MKWYIWNYNKRHWRWPHWKSITIRMELANQTKINFEIVECTVPMVVKGFKVSAQNCYWDWSTLYVLRSNFLGTAFTVFDSGISHHRGRAMPDGSNVREELAAVHYVSVQITGCGLLCELIGPVGVVINSFQAEAHPHVLFSSYWYNFGYTILCTHV